MSWRRWPRPPRKSAPLQLLHEAAADTFVGLADNEVWRISLAGAEPASITARTGLKIATIAWPPADDPGGECELVLRTTTRGPAKP